MIYIKAFITGGIICMAGQILIDKTSLTPARILVSYVIAGAFLELFGLYGKLIEFAGAGASVPISGFGCTLIKGAREAVSKDGIVGIFTGGLTSCAAGICASVVFSLIAAFIFRPKAKDQ